MSDESQEPTVSKELNTLKSRIDDLSGIAKNLLGRLTGVLLSNEKPKEAQHEKAPNVTVSCNLEKRIRDCRDVVENTAQTIRDAIERLCI